MKTIATEIMLLLFVIAFLALSGAAWVAGHELIVRFYCIITYKVYGFLDFLSFIDSASARDLLKSAGTHARRLSLSQFFYVINETALIYSPLYLIFIAFIINQVRKSPFTRFNRQFNVNKLAKHILKTSPAVAHILKRYENFSDQLLNHTDEESKSPLSPVEFAEKYHLIDKVNKKFRKARADKIFRSQVNNQSLKNGTLILTDYEKSLAAIFVLARYFDDYQNAKKLLKDLNLSCLTTKNGYPDFSQIENEVNTVLQTDEYSNSVIGYRSSRTYLYALLDHDLSIPPAQFRWLKGLDRVLWMALTSVGRGKKFIEGAGVIAYSNTETWLKNHPEYKTVRLSPTVRPATNGLEKELLKENLIKVFVPKKAQGKFMYIDQIESLRYRTPKNKAINQEETEHEQDLTNNSHHEDDAVISETIENDNSKYKAPSFY